MAPHLHWSLVGRRSRRLLGRSHLQPLLNAGWWCQWRGDGGGGSDEADPNSDFASMWVSNLFTSYIPTHPSILSLTERGKEGEVKGGVLDAFSK